MAVADGDTISVMRDGRSVRVRRKASTAGSGAKTSVNGQKQSTSDLTFGKDVIVDVRDVDRYGRLVARVSVDGQDASLALVKVGLAWHFTTYSRDPVLAEAKRTARTAK